MKIQTLLFAFTSMLMSTTLSKAEEPQCFSRLSLGGYGEAVMTRNFYSDNVYRYSRPYEHRDDDSHGRFDLPHVVINIGYDFGKGWSMSSEIEFEHGGNESAVEMDADESGEYEAEIEKGGEVALEQFWIQKSFGRHLNIRAGEIIVPVGASNQYHLPNEFFTVYRPEGEATLFPNTWHQTGISVWGRIQNWRYEAQFLSGLDAERFGSECFIHYGATSSYEFKLANVYAGAMRVDYYGIKDLRLSVSGYAGNSFANTLRSRGSAYDDTKGTIVIGALDFQYKTRTFIVRGNYDYAHLSDAADITKFNKNFPTHNGQDGSPSKHQPVADAATCAAVETGYDVLAFLPMQSEQKLWVFGRYEYYNSMARSSQKSAYGWCEKNRMAVGINYQPVRDITIKAEFSERFFKETGLEYTTSSGSTYPLKYNDEPSISIGITYAGWFK